MKCNKCEADGELLTVLGVCADAYRCEVRHNDLLCDRIAELESERDSLMADLRRITWLLFEGNPNHPDRDSDEATEILSKYRTGGESEGE
jgi:hypothetical protein